MDNNGKNFFYFNRDKTFNNIQIQIYDKNSQQSSNRRELPQSYKTQVKKFIANMIGKV